MKKKFPIIRPPVKSSDIWRSFFPDRGSSFNHFAGKLGASVGKSYVYLTNSGLAGFYLILNILKARSSRREVVLPAYTAGSLVVAVRKAGLKPVLCDISLEDFNSGPEELLKAVSQDTLAVVAVHMFGIPIGGIKRLKLEIPKEVRFIEDCCQAQGSRVDGLSVGDFGEVSFFSFNRGKNFSTFGGGAIAMDKADLARCLGDSLAGIKRVAESPQIFLALKLWFSIFATNPFIYGWIYPLLSRFKENAPPNDFTVGKLSAFRGSLAEILSQSLENVFLRRHENGEYLAAGLKGAVDLRLAEIKPNCLAVYNRLPVLFEDLSILEKKEKELWRAGFESSRMYLNPLHRMFDLGYHTGDFPNAEYFAGHVLTLPVYPALSFKDLDKIIEVIKR